MMTRCYTSEGLNGKNGIELVENMNVNGKFHQRGYLIEKRVLNESSKLRAKSQEELAFLNS